MHVFNPKHFCPSWVACCEENLALKPKHPKISEEMSLEEVFKVLTAIETVWHCHCRHRTATFEECAKSIITSREQASIIIKKLSKCSCCTRHTIHRPTRLEDLLWKSHVVPLPEQDEEAVYGRYTVLCKCLEGLDLHKDYRCDCVCRNQSRLIQSFFTTN